MLVQTLAVEEVSAAQPDVAPPSKKSDQTRVKASASPTLGGKSATPKKGADQLDCGSQQGVRFTYSVQVRNG